ncbi:MAG: ABC transporter ATP-binding protein, partial [Oscillospiraceae bacterium]|nr:ABC transporter ATP-binding protein [Oscillospiraceae bacterium]
MNDKKMNGKRPAPDMATVKRLLSYFRHYRIQMIFVFICIILATAASVASSLFIKTLIDDYITPLVGVSNPDFSALIGALFGMAALYLAGICSTFFYNRTMAKVSQNILKDIRSSMFRHMQRLPIKYFDTHSHGDVMSYYTNDADTLRQMLSQSIPQVIQSVLSIVFVFVSMLIQSVWLTVFVLIFTFFMLKLLGKITGKS